MRQCKCVPPTNNLLAKKMFSKTTDNQQWKIDKNLKFVST